MCQAFVLSLQSKNGQSRRSRLPDRHACRGRTLRLTVRACAGQDAGGFRLFNTLSNTKEPFEKPVHEDGVVRFYSCGPTVYDSAHIGNFRAFLTYDVLKRWLLYRGYPVKHVMNLTDVDDKIIKRVQSENTSLPELTEKYSQLFFKDLELLNVLPAEVYPRATDHIEDMVTLIEGLKDRGAAYEKSGSTYFKVEAFPEYGKLVKLEKRQSGARQGQADDGEEYAKDDVRDFALWKSFKEEDGAVKWETTLGCGRPGWHIECSCMAMKYLGPSMDIHGGGVDLVFPHHENEIAQSEAYTGKQYARFWVHNGFVNIDGEKMSKSLGNFRTLRDIVQGENDARAFRYLVVASQYRSTLNFTPEVLKSSKNTLKRLDGLRDSLASVTEDSHDESASAEVREIIERARKKFTDGMNDDLNTPRALAGVFELVSATGKMLKAGKLNKNLAGEVDACLMDFDRVLGVLERRKTGDDTQASGGDGSEDVPSDMQELLERRADARKSKDYSLADEIRDEILKRGYVVKDTPQGAKLIKQEA